MSKTDWKLIFSKPSRAACSPRTTESFIKSESGLMTIMALFYLLIIFTVAGFAVDIMRYDRERAKLQYALDRAVLAAADLDQDLCPADVVKDYLSKEGLDKYLIGEPVVTPNICGASAVTIDGYRKVEATAKADIGMHFMQWWGVDTIAATTVSVAEEAIDDVEISLVLDVSGSMNSYNRLTNLKKAAKKFVQEMADKTEDGKLSISIVPYATQVSLPDNLMNELSTSGINNHANCINFADSEFSTTNFDLSIIRERTLHFTVWGSGDQRPSNGLVNSEICERDANREVTVLQKDPNVLKQSIEDFVAGGNTSIELGLKWGITLLDQSFQPVASRMAANGDIPAEFATRPNTYASADSMKVIVLMTDGANTTQYRVDPPYRSNGSNIWWNSTEQSYSFFVPGDDNNSQNDYTWHNVPVAEYDYSRGWYWARETKQSHAYGNEDTYRVYRCTYYSYGTCYNKDYNTFEDRPESGDSLQLEWHQVWERTTRSKLYYLFRDYVGSSYAYDWYYDAVTSIGPSSKDPNARSLCAAARSKNIVIFTIAFEAPTAGKNLLKDCKSDDGAYYEATGDEIVDVFASIGSSIRNLRLTQ